MRAPARLLARNSRRAPERATVRGSRNRRYATARGRRATTSVRRTPARPTGPPARTHASAAGLTRFVAAADALDCAVAASGAHAGARTSARAMASPGHRQSNFVRFWRDNCEFLRATVAG
jgi:hypothetical protein